jgi:hypothetical protein
MFFIRVVESRWEYGWAIISIAVPSWFFSPFSGCLRARASSSQYHAFFSCSSALRFLFISP